ncbi:MAG: VOC family protein [Thermomonas sp.]
MFKNLIPKIFYDHLQDGLDFFVDGLGFELLHGDDGLAVIARDGAKAYLVESPEYAAKDRPELAVDTDDVDAIHAEIAARAPQLLHPNVPTVRPRPWGSREFAVLDKTTVCVVFREWPER